MPTRPGDRLFRSWSARASAGPAARSHAFRSSLGDSHQIRSPDMAGVEPVPGTVPVISCRRKLQSGRRIVRSLAAHTAECGRTTDSTLMESAVGDSDTARRTRSQMAFDQRRSRDDGKQENSRSAGTPGKTTLVESLSTRPRADGAGARDGTDGQAADRVTHGRSAEALPDEGIATDGAQQHLSQPIVVPAPPKAITIREFIKMVQTEEARWPVAERTQTALMITRLRKIFYGSEGWD